MNVDIVEALKTARYNETVEVSISNFDAGAKEDIVLIACLDDDNGGIQWNNINSACDSKSIILRKHLRTKRWFLPMLNDKRRNELYSNAIEKASEAIRQQIQRNDKHNYDEVPTTLHSLDIGSGSGLLAMLSFTKLYEVLNRNANNFRVKITSFEMSSAMAELARRTVSSNNLTNKIQIVECHSCSQHNIDPSLPKAILCTSELLESGLLAEGWLPAMRDAWERHLDPNAIVVPQRAHVYARVVEGESLSKFWGPHQQTEFSENKILKLGLPSSSGEFLPLLGGGEEMDGVQVALHTNALDGLTFLSEPISVLDIDVSSKASIPSPQGQCNMREFTPVASGTAHAVLFWWDLEIFGESTYTTNPNEVSWQDHWHQCLYIFTKIPLESTKLVKGIPALIKARHDDLRIQFAVFTDDGNPHADKKVKPIVPRFGRCDMQTLVSPDRAWQLNDVKRIRTLKDGVQAALQKQGLDGSVVLDLSDFSLCAMIAAMLGAGRVTSLESSSGSLPLLSAKIAQLTNGLPSNPDNSHEFQIVNGHAEQLTVDVLGGRVANVVVAEPYYEVLEGWHLQEALNYLYTLRALKRRGVVCDDAVSVPSFASVVARAVEARDVFLAYSSCDVELQGFRHDTIRESTRGAVDHDVPLPIWQYNATALTDPVEVCRIEYRTCEITRKTPVIKVPFTRAGTCHGMIVHVEYGLTNYEVDEEKTTWMSTQRRGYNQGVQILSSPVEIKPSDFGNVDKLFCCKLEIGKDQGKNQQNQDYQFEISVERAS